MHAMSNVAMVCRPDSASGVSASNLKMSITTSSERLSNWTVVSDTTWRTAGGAIWTETIGRSFEAKQHSALAGQM